jgi:DNA-binding transcriptional MerR regulator
MDEKLSLKEVSAALKESPNVIRNWIRDYKPYIPIEKADNGYNTFGEEAVAVLRRIKQLARVQHYSKRQIMVELAGVNLSGIQMAAADPSMPVIVDPAVIAELTAKVDQLLEGQKRMDRLLESQQRIESFQRELMARLDAPIALPEPPAKRPWWKFF